MSRSRKQRERKLKAKLHEAQVKAAAIKKQLAMQNGYAGFAFVKVGGEG